MICRDATIGDAFAMAQVWVAAWQSAYAGLMPAAYLNSLDAHKVLPRFEDALRGSHRALVVELDRHIVGFSSYGVSRDPDAGPRTGEVMAINLHPSTWRRGVGRELLGETQERLRAMGFSEATLWVLHDNTRARAFYSAAGWRPDGAEKHDDALTGFPLHDVRYRITLS